MNDTRRPGVSSALPFMTILPPNAQIMTDPMLMSVLTIAGKALSMADALASVSYHSWFSFLKRLVVPSSLVKDFTTRMPGIVSVRTLC